MEGLPWKQETTCVCTLKCSLPTAKVMPFVCSTEEEEEGSGERQRRCVRDQGVRDQGREIKGGRDQGRGDQEGGEMSRVGVGSSPCAARSCTRFKEGSGKFQGRLTLCSSIFPLGPLPPLLSLMYVPCFEPASFEEEVARKEAGGQPRGDDTKGWAQGVGVGGRRELRFL